MFFKFEKYCGKRFYITVGRIQVICTYIVTKSDIDSSSVINVIKQKKMSSKIMLKVLKGVSPKIELGSISRNNSMNLRPDVEFKQQIRNKTTLTSIASHERSKRSLLSTPSSTFCCLLRLREMSTNVKTGKEQKFLPFSDFLTDTHGRQHNYLRISITEKCNLRYDQNENYIRFC